MAFSVVRNDSDAADVISESIYRAYKNLHTVKSDAAFKPWILRIVHNTAVEAIRKGSKIITVGEVPDLPNDGCENDITVRLTSLVKERVERTLDALSESICPARKERLVKRVAAAAACIAFALLIVLPNVSSSYAEAAESIPLLGKIVRVVTIRNYFYDDGKYELDIDVPQLEKDDSEAVDYINKDVGELTPALVKQFNSDLDISGNNGYGSIRVDYEVLTNTESFFTLKLSVSETAGSSNRYYRFYHIDKSTWQRTELGDFFASDSYRSVLSEEIKRQMSADPNISYRINGSGDGEDFTAVDASQSFYFNENGDLVMVFDKYEVAPGSVGCPEFVIDIKLLEPLLKEAYATAH